MRDTTIYNYELIMSFLQAANIDIGENVSVPINQSRGQWWNYVLAGGLAGIII